MKWEKRREPLSNSRKWVDYLTCYHVADLISEQVSDFRFGHLSVFSGVRKSSESNFFSLSNSLSFFETRTRLKVVILMFRDKKEKIISQGPANWLSRGFPGLRILVELWVTSTSPLVVADKTCRNSLPNSSLPIYFESLQQLPLSCKCSSKRSPHQSQFNLYNPSFQTR